MNKNLLIVFIVLVVLLTAIVGLHKERLPDYKLEKLRQSFALKPESSVDHSELAELNRKFETPQDVTRTCNSCHNKRAAEIMNSSHWNWERTAYIEGRGLAFIGKKNIINNFCIGASANEQAWANGKSPQKASSSCSSTGINYTI